MCVCTSCTDFLFPFQDGSDLVDTEYVFVEWFVGKNGVRFALINFLASIAFGVGKLFPADYLCKTQTCKKVSHNSVMSLCLFVFDVSDLVIAFYMKQEGKQPLPCGLDQACPSLKKFLAFTDSTVGKVINLISGLAYLIFDAIREEKPGSGTSALVALACTAEVIKMLLDIILWYRKSNKKGTQNGTDQQESNGMETGISIEIGNVAPKAEVAMREHIKTNPNGDVVNQGCDTSGGFTDDDAITSRAVHHGVSCDGCATSPVVGLRWKCKQCANYDLCNTCYNSFCGNRDIHDASHTFENVGHSSS